MTSSLHLLVLQEGQAGTMLSRVYRPPRESASMQSRCSGLSVAPQYAQPPQAAERGPLLVGEVVHDPSHAVFPSAGLSTSADRHSSSVRSAHLAVGMLTRHQRW